MSKDRQKPGHQTANFRRCPAYIISTVSGGFPAGRAPDKGRSNVRSPKESLKPACESLAVSDRVPPALHLTGDLNFKFLLCQMPPPQYWMLS
jgi:hypothetical protein